MNTQLATLKAELKSTIATAMVGLKLDPVLFDRTKVVVEIMKKHTNEELVVPEVISMVTEQFRNNPELIKKDAVVIDGVMYSPVTDEMEAQEAFDALDNHCSLIGAEGAATVAFIAIATAEVMFEAA